VPCARLSTPDGQLRTVRDVDLNGTGGLSRIGKTLGGGPDGYLVMRGKGVREDGVLLYFHLSPCRRDTLLHEGPFSACHDWEAQDRPVRGSTERLLTGNSAGPWSRRLKPDCPSRTCNTATSLVCPHRIRRCGGDPSDQLVWAVESATSLLNTAIPGFLSPPLPAVTLWGGVEIVLWISIAADN